ncbi:hypothetical protein KGF56_000192 [Candida oxycetoniae]|uniref:MIR domain-containing protein n=1 Tax=Candida oxycetoniae TaxID=497107 RepID=A0AAI9T2D8_9ASCO|nr:uncharacterized protein KGF56_000192 [Candida oxycetoniae]KAI3406900.2 hypothetical protein KGF56_000192 [Candida oxycetoniae]
MVEKDEMLRRCENYKNSNSSDTNESNRQSEEVEENQKSNFHQSANTTTTTTTAAAATTIQRDKRVEQERPTKSYSHGSNNTFHTTFSSTLHPNRTNHERMDYDSALISITSKTNSRDIPNKESFSNSSTPTAQEEPVDSFYERFIIGDIVRNFSPAYFVSVMGTGISSSLLYHFPFPAQWLIDISYIMFAVACLLFICNTALFIMSCIYFPGRLRAYHIDPSHASYMGCFSMGYITLVNYIATITKAHHMYLVWTLWWIAVASAMYTAFIIVYLAYFSKLNKVELDAKLNATLLLPIVAITVVSSSGHSIELNLYHKNEIVTTMIVSFMLWCLSVSLAFMIMTIYVWRLIVHKIPPTKLIFTGFLPVGFLGQSSYSVYLFGNNLNEYIPEELLYGKILLCICGFFAMFLLSLGYFMTFIAITSILSKIRPFANTPNIQNTNKLGMLKHHKGFWAMTFPLGTMALGNTEIGNGGIGDYPLLAFRYMGAIFAVACIIITTSCLMGPQQVVFDELHTWRQIQHYFDGTFYLDVHPPLGKLVFYLLSRIGGWKAVTSFDSIGQTYIDEPFVLMRMFSSVCGILSVDLFYMIMRLENNGYAMSMCSSLLICFENSMITQSRFILVDAMLLLGQIMVIFTVKSFLKVSFYSWSWWAGLLGCGISIGWTISIKLNGWLTLIWVGILILHEVWEMLDDLTITTMAWFKHVTIRVFGFLLLPLTIYCATWSTFQGYHPDPVEVLYGSTITLKHTNLEKYLHSHDATYPKGSNLQQVTLYEFDNDANNEWVIETPHKYYEERIMKRVTPVKDGDTIRLYHKATGHYLHVNDIRPPISEHEYSNEVNCNETRGLLGNSEYEFKLRIVSKKRHSVNNLPMIKLRATETIFQLVHRDQKCLLMSHATRLPSWGKGQNEVLCVKEGTIPNSLWYVERNTHPMLEQIGDAITKVDFSHSPFTFWHKMWEIHWAMMRLNSGFTENQPSASTAESWPILKDGIPYFQSVATLSHDASQVFYLGNICLYYTSFIFMVICLVKTSFHIVWNMNPYTQHVDSPTKTRFYQNAIQYQLGWIIHYWPYFFISRNLYLHHYLPALVFAVLNMAEYINYQKKHIRASLMLLILMGVVYCYWKGAPLIYNLPWSSKECLEQSWLPSWNLNCNIYSS